MVSCRSVRRSALPNRSLRSDVIGGKSACLRKVVTKENASFLIPPNLVVFYCFEQTRNTIILLRFTNIPKVYQVMLAEKQNSVPLFFGDRVPLKVIEPGPTIKHLSGGN